MTTMKKSGLSNSLIDCTIARTQGLEHLFDNFGPTARITAAWVDSGSVKVAAVDSHGRVKEFYLSSVRVFEIAIDATTYTIEFEKRRAAVQDLIERIKTADDTMRTVLLSQLKFAEEYFQQC